MGEKNCLGTQSREEASEARLYSYEESESAETRSLNTPPIQVPFRTPDATHDRQRGGGWGKGTFYVPGCVCTHPTNSHYHSPRKGLCEAVLQLKDDTD